MPKGWSYSLTWKQHAVFLLMLWQSRTASKNQGTPSSPGPAQAGWLQHMSSVCTLALLVAWNKLQEELCFTPLRSAILRQGRANLTAHCYSVSTPLCSQQCPWTGNKFSVILLAVNLPYHYINTGARMGVAAEAHGWANGRDVTIPVAPRKQFKLAVCIGFVWQWD